MEPPAPDDASGVAPPAPHDAPGVADSTEWRDAVRKARADFPELTVREIADKSGVAFQKVKNFLAKERSKSKQSEADGAPKGEAVVVAASTEGRGGDKAYRLEAVPGKGMGMFATRDIKYGELLLAEKPLMIVDDWQQRTGGGAAIEAAFRQLSAEDQARVMALHDAHTGAQGPTLGTAVAERMGSTPDGRKTAAAIFRTNCLAAGVNSIASVLCDEVSRFNHSCAQNVAHAWAPPYERIYAIRDVREGEELCTSYCGPVHCFAERQARLKMVYGFTCECSKCGADPAERARSDKRRTKYERLDEKIPEVGSRDQRQALGLIAEVFDLVKEEEPLNQPAVLMRHAYDGFQMACALQNLAQAKKWIQKAYDYCVIENGEEHEKSREFACLLNNPRSHRLWR